jgi:hypothetical protein
MFRSSDCPCWTKNLILVFGDVINSAAREPVQQQGRDTVLSAREAKTFNLTLGRKHLSANRQYSILQVTLLSGF